MAKEEPKETQTQTPEQAMYADYVKGANAETLAEKYQLEPSEALAMIESVQASNVKR